MGGKRKCAVLGCTSYKLDQFDIALHHITHDKPLYREWLELCGRTRGSRKIHVCSQHFDDSQYGDGGSRMFLKRNQKPCRLLPPRRAPKLCSLSINNLGSSRSVVPESPSDSSSRDGTKRRPPTSTSPADCGRATFSSILQSSDPVSLQNESSYDFPTEVINEIFLNCKEEEEASDLRGNELYNNCDTNSEEDQDDDFKYVLIGEDALAKKVGNELVCVQVPRENRIPCISLCKPTLSLVAYL